MKRVLLTGASGYIGRHMLDDLVARGFEVHAVSRNPLDDAAGITWHATDLLDVAATSTLLADVGASHLMHLAWITEPGVYQQSPQNTQWLAAGISLIENFERHGGKRALIAGTCAEYDWSNGYCVEYETPLRAKSAYAESKLALRDAALRLDRETELTFAWARVFFSFGPFEQAERLVPAVIRALLGGERAACIDGQLVRDFMYVPDVASGLIAVLDHEYRGDINIASGKPVSIEKLVTHIASRLDASNRIDFGKYPRRPDDPQEISADTSRLNDIVGWTPEYDLESALDKTIDWWRNQV